MKLGTLILSAGTLCLVCTALYISFSSVGAETIDGVQPRYLLPMMLTSLLMLKPNYIRNPIPDKWYHGMMLLGMCVVSLIGMHPLLLLLAAV